MSKPWLGLLLGSILGLLDGLSAFLYPDAAPMIVQIVFGSTVKGLVTGLAMGFLARRLRSLPAGILAGLALGLGLSFLAAMAPDPQGRHHYFEIMAPGGILGVIVGFATQRYGRSRPARSDGPGAAVLLLLSLASSPGRAEPPKPSDPWAPFRPLVGVWEGEEKGKPGTGKGTQRYEFVLGGRYLQVQNLGVYEPQPANPKGERHEDWGLISHDKKRGTFVWRQFHVEGFVNQYVLERGPDPRTLVFVTESIENIPPGWRARETLKLVGADELAQTFELAEPGKGFEVYTEGRFRRRP
jgi:hypothetical protein